MEKHIALLTELLKYHYYRRNDIYSSLEDWWNDLNESRRENMTRTFIYSFLNNENNISPPL